LVALALVRGPLIYDGSFFLFHVLQTGAPFIPDNRVVAVPVHLVTLAVAHLTSDTWAIALAFSAMYIALAAGAYLGTAWWLRRHRPGLVAWPLLGLLAVVPILVDTTTESLVTGGLAFALVYLAAVPKTAGRVTGAVVVAIVLFASHPAAGLVLILAGVAAAVRAVRGAARLEAAFAMVALAAGVLRLRLLVPGYETQVGDPQTFVATLAKGISYPVAAMVVSVWITGAGLVLSRHRRLDRRVVRYLPALPLAGTLPLAASLLFGHGWPPPLDYRLATIPALLPLLVMLVVDATEEEPRDHAPGVTHLRVAAMALVAVSVCVGIQAWRWQGEVSRMRSYVAALAGPCGAEVTGSGTALSHWGARSLAVLVQGRAPRVVLGSDADCRQLTASRLYSGSRRFVALYPGDAGWFHFPGR